MLYFIYQKQKPIRLSAESRLDGPNRVLVFDIMCFNLRPFLMWGDVFFHFHPIKFRNGITDNSVLYLKKMADRLKQSLIEFSRSKILQYPDYFDLSVTVHKLVDWLICRLYFDCFFIC